MAERSISRSKPISFKLNALSAMLSRKSYRSEVLQRMRLADGGQSVRDAARAANPAPNFATNARRHLRATAQNRLLMPEATPSVRVLLEDGAAAAAEGERKTVTALFADIKGSTELMEDLDPEEARAIVDPALKLMIDAVRRYDGYVVQSTGDGIFALFGAPVAHEDHPQRALYAALRMQEELRRYSAKLVADGGNCRSQCRVGVNTGEVVVRSIATGDGHVEYTPIGHTTNLASRMQALAPVGSIAVSEKPRASCARAISRSSRWARPRSRASASRSTFTK